MNVKVTADSTCDLSPALLARYDITLAPHGHQGWNQLCRRPHHHAPGDFQPRGRRWQPLFHGGGSVGEYQALFSRFAGSCDGLVHITIGSGFSACYQNACLAAAGFPNVRVVDSQPPTGQGHVVLEACRLRDQAASLDGLCQELEQLTGKVEASFLFEPAGLYGQGRPLLHRGGPGANLLNLKPCIEVRDGKMQVVKKVSGALRQCLANYVKDRLDGRPELRRDRLFITYTPVEPDCLAAVREAVDRYGHFREVFETSAGCTVSCHCGPGTLGVLFIRQ